MGLFSSYKPGRERMSSKDLKKAIQDIKHLDQNDRDTLYKTLKPRLDGGLTHRELRTAMKKLEKNTSDDITRPESRRIRKTLRRKFFGKK